ncbi:unnamed protein product [Vitrella brassicaformis CCMP3155]|uniref:Uncharacterized protein n=1 Tax=Vitrella brassicaformis (strain CCMP3155) TaxID=1169540 RepID=A0A0G4GWA4_VITBC|nr:unnamed protein product [Vitrella brassicaformis CCMP3155]|eukprot:CEM35288.1 unnamed protein product [Vitrella brassicaformis CCMP3155]
MCRGETCTLAAARWRIRTATRLPGLGLSSVFGGGGAAAPPVGIAPEEEVAPEEEAGPLTSLDSLIDDLHKESVRLDQEIAGLKAQGATLPEERALKTPLPDVKSTLEADKRAPPAVIVVEPEGPSAEERLAALKKRDCEYERDLIKLQQEEEMLHPGSTPATSESTSDLMRDEERVLDAMILVVGRNLKRLFDERDRRLHASPTAAARLARAPCVGGGALSRLGGASSLSAIDDDITRLQTQLADLQRRRAALG